MRSLTPGRLCSRGDSFILAFDSSTKPLHYCAITKDEREDRIKNNSHANDQRKEIYHPYFKITSNMYMVIRNKMKILTTCKILNGIKIPLGFILVHHAD